MVNRSQRGNALFATPDLDGREQEVLAQIGELKTSLRFSLYEPRRWSGALRRMTFARNIQGSNSIEGYDARLDDAAAVALGEEPLDASTETALALAGYRSAMTYVLQLVQDDDLLVSEDLVKSLHFMMTSYALQNRPGRWRVGPVYVQRELTNEIVHEGADAALVPALMSSLVGEINRGEAAAIVRAAMVHLNLVMIHPFKDSNGRMARCLQSLVLAADGTLAPVFMSVEEYLGRNTGAYYDVLARVGGGGWHPERDARPWLRFMLTAHLRQAQTLERRVQTSERVWEELDRITLELGVPERTLPALFDAVFGYRLRRATYLAALADAGETVSEQTATRDFKALVDAGLLEPVGDKRGRYYGAAPVLREIGARTRALRELKDEADPFAPD
ncbi:Fic family protein [Microbacterium sp.]|uniref:Fic family protein n=1 Tax=Microbacterium sp. TaxID=51671 RepID=UPI003C7677B7